MARWPLTTVAALGFDRALAVLDADQRGPEMNAALKLFELTDRTALITGSSPASAMRLRADWLARADHPERAQCPQARGGRRSCAQLCRDAAST
jgi:hypothetical protein